MRRRPDRPRRIGHRNVSIEDPGSQPVALTLRPDALDSMREAAAGELDLARSDAEVALGQHPGLAPRVP